MHSLHSRPLPSMQLRIAAALPQPSQHGRRAAAEPIETRTVANRQTTRGAPAVDPRVVGAFVTWISLRPLVALTPPWFPRLDSVGIDARVFLFCLGVCVAASLIFGLIPALQASRPNLVRALHDSSARATGDQEGGCCSCRGWSWCKSRWRSSC